MGEFSVSYQNIIIGKGFELALAGMVIVVVALTLISSIVALLPLFLKMYSKIHPEKEKPAAKQRKSDLDEGLIAAITLAHHIHLTKLNS
ncbi:MAG: OadG family protein [Spirochaetales bacterium]|nr:OadG family protein [Spirochaetales bacterium]